MSHYLVQCDCIYNARRIFARKLARTIAQGIFSQGIAQWIFLLVLTSTNGGDGVSRGSDIGSACGCLQKKSDTEISPDLALRLEFTSNKIVAANQT